MITAGAVANKLFSRLPTANAAVPDSPKDQSNFI